MSCTHSSSATSNEWICATGDNSPQLTLQPKEAAVVATRTMDAAAAAVALMVVAAADEVAMVAVALTTAARTRSSKVFFAKSVARKATPW